MRFVVYGAGAVGGVIGGLLSLARHGVLLICREDHARAITDQGGLRLKSATGDYFAEVEATHEPVPEHFDDDTIVLLTAKSNDTEACVTQLASLSPSSVLVVSFQNGIGNEELLQRHFEVVLGGVCRMTCSYLHVGQVSFRKQGRLIVGKYPKGADPKAKKLGKVLAEAGFDACVSNNITADKWLKLVMNLQSAFNAVVDPRDHDTPEFVDLRVGVLEEARRVLRAAKIRPRSCDGRDPSVKEVIDELKKPHAPRPQSAVKVHNSTWQNLYLERDEVESGHFHGPIIELASTNGIKVPYNQVSLDLAAECCRTRQGPGAFRAAEVLQRIREMGAR